MLQLHHEQRTTCLRAHALQRRGQCCHVFIVLVLRANDDGASRLIRHDARRIHSPWLAIRWREHRAKRCGNLRGAVTFKYRNETRRGKAGHSLCIQLLNDHLNLAKVLAVCTHNHGISHWIRHGAHPTLAFDEIRRRLPRWSTIGASGRYLLPLLLVALERGVDGGGHAGCLRVPQ